MNTTSIGTYGESAACEYLEKKGYKIVERNYKCTVAEIDIVAYDNNGTLCFAEVKTRKNSNYGFAYQAVDRKKVKKLQLGASVYAKHHKINCPMRIDVVEVYGRMTANGFQTDSINHFENVN